MNDFALYLKQFVLICWVNLTPGCAFLRQAESGLIGPVSSASQGMSWSGSSSAMGLWMGGAGASQSIPSCQLQVRGQLTASKAWPEQGGHIAFSFSTCGLPSVVLCGQHCPRPAAVWIRTAESCFTCPAIRVLALGRELVPVAVLTLFDFQLKRQLTECSYVTEAVVVP